jgi:hypothetical protein
VNKLLLLVGFGVGCTPKGRVVGCPVEVLVEERRQDIARTRVVVPDECGVGSESGGSLLGRNGVEHDGWPRVLARRRGTNRCSPPF